MKSGPETDIASRAARVSFGACPCDRRQTSWIGSMTQQGDGSGPKLSTIENVVAGLPVILPVAGGFTGGALGALLGLAFSTIASVASMGVFAGGRSAPQKYALAFGITVAAAAAFFFVFELLWRRSPFDLP